MALCVGVMYTCGCCFAVMDTCGFVCWVDGHLWMSVLWCWIRVAVFVGVMYTCGCVLG